MSRADGGWAERNSPHILPVMEARHTCTFDVDGFRLGCLGCIEVNFPALWTEQQTLGVDCMLFSTFSEDPMFEVLARAHAAVNGFWVSIAVPAQMRRPRPQRWSDQTAAYCGTLNRMPRRDL